MSNKSLGIIIVVIIVLGLALRFGGNGGNEVFETGKKQLANQGYTNIENTGHQWACCSDDDTYSVGFKCLSKDGEVVTGCICGGYSKGVTIRYQ